MYANVFNKKQIIIILKILGFTANNILRKSAIIQSKLGDYLRGTIRIFHISSAAIDADLRLS